MTSIPVDAAVEDKNWSAQRQKIFHQTCSSRMCKCTWEYPPILVYLKEFQLSHQTLHSLILHCSASGTSAYFIVHLTWVEVNEFNSLLQTAVMLFMFLPTVVLMPFWLRLDKKLTMFLELVMQSLMKLINLEQSITLGCKDPEIASMKYLWAVVGSLKANLTPIFQAVYSFSNVSLNNSYRLLP